MFKNNPEKINEIKKALITSDFTKDYSQTLSRKKCEELGLTIKHIEDDKELEKLILSIHYAFISYFNREHDSKIIVNQNGTYISSRSIEI